MVHSDWVGVGGVRSGTVARDKAAQLRQQWRKQGSARNAPHFAQHHGFRCLPWQERERQGEESWMSRRQVGVSLRRYLRFSS